ncbi:hypothetical protein HPB47_027313 [Ixodes persulcatus]|uniref:Uncharacterized protein n=1 Tax=Ixodes persulcatus TaxID=34615 RepID=A0AC60PW89_IXOPE|nr:hypothetical protein HPB47_027313 [Ixodes persulcatus]
MKKLMQPFKVGEDVGLFLVNFERTCEKLSFAPETWPQRLLTLLPCEAAEVVARLSAGDADDYDKVKSSLLKRYRLSAEAFRQRFRNASKKSSEGYSEFAYGLKTNLIEWLKSEEVYESRDKVVECVCLEQFFRSIPQSVKLWVQDRVGVDSVERAAELAEEYATRRKLSGEESESGRSDQRKTFRQGLTSWTERAPGIWFGCVRYEVARGSLHRRKAFESTGYAAYVMAMLGNDRRTMTHGEKRSSTPLLCSHNRTPSPERKKGKRRKEEARGTEAGNCCFGDIPMMLRRGRSMSVSEERAARPGARSLDDAAGSSDDPGWVNVGGGGVYGSGVGGVIYEAGCGGKGKGRQVRRVPRPSGLGWTTNGSFCCRVLIILVLGRSRRNVAELVRGYAIYVLDYEQESADPSSGHDDRSTDHCAPCISSEVKIEIVADAAG